MQDRQKQIKTASFNLKTMPKKYLYIQVRSWDEIAQKGLEGYRLISDMTRVENGLVYRLMEKVEEAGVPDCPMNETEEEEI